VKIDPNPFFRRAIVPWYDSEPVCLLWVLFLLLVFWFGMIGIKTALDIPAYRNHLIIPATLVVLSAAVIVSTTVRLVTRYLSRFSQ
jgi:hypothetical protein